MASIPPEPSQGSPRDPRDDAADDPAAWGYAPQTSWSPYPPPRPGAPGHPPHGAWPPPPPLPPGHAPAYGWHAYPPHAVRPPKKRRKTSLWILLVILVGGGFRIVGALSSNSGGDRDRVREYQPHVEPNPTGVRAGSSEPDYRERAGAWTVRSLHDRLLNELPPKDLPPPAVVVRTPQTQSSSHLDHIAADRLVSRAHRAVADGDDVLATECYEQAAARGEVCYYALACCHARRGHVDDAIYWLQRCAREEGVDARWAVRDADLVNLWADPRGERVRDDLIDCNKWFHVYGERRELHEAPRDAYDALPVIVVLHGLGAEPAGMHAIFSQFARECDAHVVSISGTWPVGPNAYTWAEDDHLDNTRVQGVLNFIDDSTPIDRKRVVLVGFSQGARTAAQLAARHPDKYRGAVLFSPGGGNLGADFPSLEATSRFRGRTVVINVGAREHYRNLDMAAQYGAWFEAAGVNVIDNRPDTAAHTLPADLSERFPKWVRLMLD